MDISAIIVEAKSALPLAPLIVDTNQHIVEQFIRTNMRYAESLYFIETYISERILDPNELTPSKRTLKKEQEYHCAQTNTNLALLYLLDTYQSN